MKVSNSPLISYTKLSPNHSGKRTHVIDTISVHCMAGNLSVETCGALFAKSSRRASSNYGIGSDGRIALYVDEGNRSWCTSSASNDQRAITIEVANSPAKDPWPVTNEAYDALIDLLVDICQRNGVKKLLWKGDKSLIGQVNQQNMTVHRWFAAKACPGDWLYERHGQIADAVNQRLTEDDIMTGEQIVQALTSENCLAILRQARAPLQDNDAGQWSEAARQWAKDNGIIAGSSSTEFNGMWEDLLTREQMAVILYRFAQLIGKA